MIVGHKIPRVKTRLVSEFGIRSKKEIFHALLLLSSSRHLLVVVVIMKEGGAKTPPSLPHLMISKINILSKNSNNLFKIILICFLVNWINLRYFERFLGLSVLPKTKTFSSSASREVTHLEKVLDLHEL